MVGKDVPVALLQAVAETSDEELRQALTRLRSAEFLYEARVFPTLEYTFKHALTHDVAYGSVLDERKTALHAAVVASVECLEPDLLAHHVDLLAHHAVRGRVWDKAVSYLRQGGRQAMASGAIAESASKYEQALALLPHLDPGPEEVLVCEVCGLFRAAPWPQVCPACGAGHG